MHFGGIIFGLYGIDSNYSATTVDTMAVYGREKETIFALQTMLVSRINELLGFGLFMGFDEKNRKMRV